jgi:SAM-dependent MidA family methyltransferase
MFPSSPLPGIIRAHISRTGPIPFSSFMALALYHPEHGYYAKGPGRTGRGGDFFTSVSVGPVFGELLAGQFCEVWEQLGRPDTFTVLERGAGDGAFARDVLIWAAEERPDFAAALHYRIDEPLAALESAQRNVLADFPGRVDWGFGEPVTGVFFANELLDAIPFRRVRWNGSEWRELVVGLDNAGDFVWLEEELRDYASLRRLTELGTAFPVGYTTEVAPAVATEVWQAAAALRQGALFFIDYGFPGADYYHPSRTTGTLRCYRGHNAHEDPFDAVGETDITAHVDFTLAARAAVRAGGEILAFPDQSRFLTGAAASALRLMEGKNPGATATKWLRQFQTLTHPSQLGNRFHVLAIGKGLPPGFRLTGLQHARERDATDLQQSG